MARGKNGRPSMLSTEPLRRDGLLRGAVGDRCGVGCGGRELDIAINVYGTAHFQLVEPDGCLAGPTVDVDEHEIDIGAAGIDLGTVLSAQHADLPLDQLGKAGDFQPLPRTRVFVLSSAHNRGERFLCGGIETIWKNDAGEQLQSRAIGFEHHGEL